MAGRSVRLFLVDGAPQGMRTAEIINWTGLALACPRTDLSGANEVRRAARESPKQGHAGRADAGEAGLDGREGLLLALGQDQGYLRVLDARTTCQTACRA